MVPFLLTCSALAAPSRVWVRIEGEHERELVSELGMGFVERQDGQWMLFDADEAHLVQLRGTGLQWRVDSEPVPRHGDLSAYHTPSGMVFALDLLQAAYPDLVTRVDIGLSVAGRELSGVLVTAAEEPRAVWRVLGTHHGDEMNSGEVALSVAQWLCEDYDLDPVVREILDKDAVLVVPQVNPDGVQLESRYNMRSVDLNRNYSYEWTAAEYRSGEAPFSEPETRAVRTLTQWYDFVAGLSMHSGAANIGWVWNYTTDPSDDAALVTAMGEAYGDACATEGFWTTNGAEWYITYGDSTDWSYGRHGILDFTVEVDLDKNTEDQWLDELGESHWNAVVRFLSWPDIVHGQVVDAETGRGIPATLVVVEGGAPFGSGPRGRFARPVLPGTWTLEVSSAGYAPQVVSAGAEELLVALKPRGRGQLRPEPVVLSRGSSGSFALEADVDSVVLTRPGEDPVVATGKDGLWHVDLDRMAPGPWDLWADDEVSPRAIFAGELDDEIVLSLVELGDGEVSVEGEGLALGSRSFAVWGPDRAWVELEVLEADDESLLLDAGPLDDASGAVDLLVLSGGRQLAVADLMSGAAIDTATPADSGIIDTGTGDTARPDTRADTGMGPRSRCSGCAASRGAGPAPFLLSLLALVGRRRNT